MGTTGSPTGGAEILFHVAAIMGLALLAFALGGYGNAVAGARPSVGRAFGLLGIGMSVVNILVFAAIVLTHGGLPSREDPGAWITRGVLFLGPIFVGIGACLRAAGWLRDDDLISG